MSGDSCCSKLLASVGNSTAGKSGLGTRSIIIISSCVVGGVLLLIALAVFFVKRSKKSRQQQQQQNMMPESFMKQPKDDYFSDDKLAGNELSIVASGPASASSEHWTQSNLEFHIAPRPNPPPPTQAARLPQFPRFKALFSLFRRLQLLRLPHKMPQCLLPCQQRVPLLLQH